jgi:hypothetical protein
LQQQGQQQLQLHQQLAAAGAAAAAAAKVQRAVVKPSAKYCTKQQDKHGICTDTLGCVCGLCELKFEAAMRGQKKRSWHESCEHIEISQLI